MKSLLRPERICGLAVFAVGAGVALEASRYPIGQLVRMGPGYLPLFLGLVMAALGVAILFEKDAPERVPLSALRPILAITAALVAWVALVDRMGFVIATTALVVLANLAEPGFRPIPIAISTAALCAMGALIFIFGFGVPLSLWPR